MGSESHRRRGSPQKASWRLLGALLELLGAEKTKLESLLFALGVILEPVKAWMEGSVTYLEVVVGE